MTRAPPGLTQACEDLTQALALEPEHLSYYQLTLEPNTPYNVAPSPLPDDNLGAGASYLEALDRTGPIGSTWMPRDEEASPPPRGLDCWRSGAIGSAPWNRAAGPSITLSAFSSRIKPRD